MSSLFSVTSSKKRSCATIFSKFVFVSESSVIMDVIAGAYVLLVMDLMVLDNFCVVVVGIWDVACTVFVYSHN